MSLSIEKHQVWLVCNFVITMTASSLSFLHVPNLVHFDLTFSLGKIASEAVNKESIFCYLSFWRVFLKLILVAESQEM